MTRPGRRRPRGGVGSNQYQTRPAANTADVSDRAARFAHNGRPDPVLARHVNDALDAYREHCHTQGIDPELAIIEARATRGEDAATTALRALTGAGDDLSIDWILDDLTNREDPAEVWALAVVADPDHPDSASRRAGIAANKECPRDLYGILARSDETHVRVGAAANPGADDYWLDQLANDPCPHVRAALAGRSRLPGWVAERLARDENEDVRAALASGLRDGLRLWRRLARDPSPVVRQALASNRCAPGRVLAGLAGRARRWPSPAVGATLACNPATPAGALVRLARHPNVGVRSAVATSGHTPVAALLMLADDDELPASTRGTAYHQAHVRMAEETGD